MALCRCLGRLPRSHRPLVFRSVRAGRQATGSHCGQPRMTVTPDTMEASEQPQPPQMVYAKMERIIRAMQHAESGVPVRMQKTFLTTIPCAFTGYDLIEWLQERLGIEDVQEATHLATLLCQHGYFFPVTDTKALNIKEDNALYRFQTPYFWPSQNWEPDSVDYSIYLVKRSMRNKQKHGLEEYEQVAYNKLQKMLSDKWDFIRMQAEEQVRLAKEKKKADKVVIDSQERAFWRVHRPPPGHVKCLEDSVRRTINTSLRHKNIPRTKESYRKQIEFLRQRINQGRMKTSKAAESLMQRTNHYSENDPFLRQPLPSNPWISDDTTMWTLNHPTAPIPTCRQVRRWGFDIKEILSDPKGRREFEFFLQKEFSSENLHFWLACNNLRGTPLSRLEEEVQNIYKEFLAQGAPSEINIDGKTMDRTLNEMKTPSRYTYDAAKDHIYVLMKKDSYARFLRSDHYKDLMANAINPCPKKKFFNFVNVVKKRSPNPSPKPKRRGSANNEFHTDTRMISAMSQHSFSTGNLRDLVAPDKGGKGSPFGSSSDMKNAGNDGSNRSSLFPESLQAKLQSLIHHDSSNSKTLAVPTYRGRLSLGGNTDDGNVNITVPNASINVVAPWEDE